MAHVPTALQAIILDSAADNIEQREGWKLTRQYSFPKLSFKSTPGVDKPSPLSLRQKTETNQSARPQAGNAGAGTGRRSANSSVQQPVTPLVTELTTSATVNSAQQGKSSKSSGFKFPASQQKSNAAASGPSASSSGTSAVAAMSKGESDQGFMTAVSTSRSEAVKVNSGASDQAGSAAGDERQPKYELVYRGHVDLAESWQDPAANTAAARHPKVNSIVLTATMQWFCVGLSLSIKLYHSRVPLQCACCMRLFVMSIACNNSLNKCANLWRRYTSARSASISALCKSELFRAAASHEPPSTICLLAYVQRKLLSTTLQTVSLHDAGACSQDTPARSAASMPSPAEH